MEHGNASICLQPYSSNSALSHHTLHRSRAFPLNGFCFYKDLMRLNLQASKMGFGGNPLG